MMEKIASFKVNHNILEKGLYISRTDRDIITYDVRMKKPNNNDYLQNATMHTLEHLFATYVRNSNYSKDIVYVGPMGCRTGFYFIVRDNISNREVLNLLIDTFKFISEYQDKIPGADKIECGNYLEHNLNGAKNIASDMFAVLKNWSVEKMKYAE